MEGCSCERCARPRAPKGVSGGGPPPGDQCVTRLHRGVHAVWAEGDKARNHVGVANSDPELLACFVAFIRNHFNVENEKMRIACNLFADHAERIVEVEDFWLSTLGLTRANLRKSMVNKYSKHSQKKRRNLLPYGTCKLVVHSTEIVQTIYGSIQEYAGFNRDEWLD
jgi:hypothetical protein